ncbi:MAG TPA: hypothetical protein DEA52_03890 [Clostridiaceae bacterium]|nr:hypothetical protein [Clostridiaceae bacterium]
MVYLFMGPSCTGKSTVAKALQNQLSLTIYEGKDYLRLAKNQGQAYACFSDILLKASESEASHVIYRLAENTRDFSHEMNRLRARGAF